MKQNFIYTKSFEKWIKLCFIANRSQTNTDLKYKIEITDWFWYLSFPRERYKINEIIVARNNGMTELINQIESLTQTINKFIDRSSHLHSAAYALNHSYGTVCSPQPITPRARDTLV